MMESAKTDALSTFSEFEKADCEREPIRFPGAIQPYGALLVLNSGSELIQAVSQSCTELFGLHPDQLLGRGLSEIIEKNEVATLLQFTRGGFGPLSEITLNGHSLTARAHKNQLGETLVEVEREGADATTSIDILIKLRRGLSDVRQMRDIQAVSQSATALIRDITGYDRVMVYYFDEDWNGQVLAESCAAEIEPYFGLTFPASDIPKQARDLFQTSGVRMIPDVYYVPSPLVAKGEVRSIDLGSSSLRSVSPIHIQYLKNMEVRATLVGSLVIEGKLWGLVSCQGKSAPQYFGPATREVLAWACEDIAAVLAATQLRTAWERGQSLAMRRRELLEMLRSTDFTSLIRNGKSSDLLNVTESDGFALIVGDNVESYGTTPTAERILKLETLRHKVGANTNLFASNALFRDLGDENTDDGIAGALFVSVSQLPAVTMIWFRQERSLTIRWGGDPSLTHSKAVNGALSPRASFKQFLQNIRGTALPWTTEELASAAELGSLIEIETVRKTRFELSASEARSRLLWESELIGIISTSISGLVTDANDKFLQMLKFSRVDLRSGLINWVNRTRPEYREITQQSLDELNSFGVNRKPFETQLIDQDGTSISVLMAVVLPDRLSGVAFVLDMTEKKTSESRIRAMAGERVNIVKAMAASIAHELNQPLAATSLLLGSAAQLVEMEPDQRPVSLTKVLSQANAQVVRSGRILKHLREFIAHGEPRMTITHLHELIQEAVSETAGKAEERGINVRLELDAANDEVFADAVQIVQVLINLLRNADEAIDDGADRLIVISTAMPNECHIQVNVADTGCGLSAKVAAALFEPFVTTKAGGMGVGLVISRIIIEAHYGTLSAFRNAGVGATFYFTLPIIGLRDNRLAMPKVERS